MAKKKSDKPKQFMKFAASQKSPTLEIGHGEYRRKFEAKDQPFAVDQEEAKFLKGTGHFVDAAPPVKKPNKSSSEKIPPASAESGPTKSEAGSSAVQ